MKERQGTSSQSPIIEGADVALNSIKLEDPPKGGLYGGRILRMTGGLEGERGKSKGSSKDSSPAMSKSRSNTPSTPGCGNLGDVKCSIPVKLEAGDNQPSSLPPSSQKLSSKKSPDLFGDYPDSTREATSTFAVIDECIYSSKWIGDSGQDGEVMSCECKNEWDGTQNIACSENSDCINRMTSMECTQDDRGCGQDCQNQRFQKRQYADVSVIKTEKKGFGLRANCDIAANTFLYEYVGEVIDESKFRRRMEKYDLEGIKHFYFMSLGKNEFIDATKKGGLARFCNHSCNPNCFIDKWVVGEKLRMGIFAKRKVKAGEELVFDYNVDRYGAEPQTCYCGEPNCLGYIGGKTQTDGAAPKLSHHIIEALGLEDSEGWSTAAAKKGRRSKKVGDDDEDYVEDVKSKPLGEADVTKVMSSLLHCKEKWIVSKLLSRIQLSEDDAVPARVVKMHGYQILGKILHDFVSDDNIVLMALDILMKFPRITKNKITSSKIEPTVQQLGTAEDERVRQGSKALLDVWSSLETGFRIPRRSKAANERSISVYHPYERETSSRSKSNSPQPDHPATPNRPRGHQKPSFQGQPPRGPRAERFQRHDDKPRRELPWGWHKAFSEGQLYYYANDGRSRWDTPLEPCGSDARLPKPPPPPPRPGELPTDEKRKVLQAIIDDITRSRSYEKASKSELERQKEDERVRQLELEQDEERRRQMKLERGKRKDKDAREKKDKIYDEDKTKNILMKTFAKVVANAVSKYEPQLGGRDQVKKHAKDITEILVKKETKDGRQVINPHLLLESEKRRLKVKNFVKPYMEKVIDHNRKERERRKQRKNSSPSQKQAPSPQSSEKKDDSVESPFVPVVEMSPIGDTTGTNMTTPTAENTPTTTPGKRRRGDDGEGEDSVMVKNEERQSPKRLRPASPQKDISPPTGVPEVMAVGGGVFVC